MPALLVQLRSASSEVSLLWDGQPLTVGRSLDNIIVLSLTGISGRHLLLESYPDGEQFLATDLGSRNGTWLIDQRLSEPTPILPGEPLDLAGEIVLRVLRVEDVDLTAATVTPAHAASHGGGLALRLVIEGACNRPSARLLGFGRADACRFRPSHGATLLAVLAQRLQSAFPSPGWVFDDDLRVALWGRAGLLADPNNLNVVIYRLRQRMLSSGFPPTLLEKELNRVRLRDCDVTFRDARARPVRGTPP